MHLPLFFCLGVVRALHEPAQRRNDDAIQHLWLHRAPIFPREVAVPFAPGRARRLEFVCRSGKSEITDRDDAGALTRLNQMTTAVAEGVELLCILECQISLLF